MDGEDRRSVIVAIPPDTHAKAVAAREILHVAESSRRIDRQSFGYGCSRILGKAIQFLGGLVREDDQLYESDNIALNAQVGKR